MIRIRSLFSIFRLTEHSFKCSLTQLMIKYAIHNDNNCMICCCVSFPSAYFVRDKVLHVGLLDQCINI